MLPYLQDRDFREAIVDSLIHAVDTPDPQYLKCYPTSAAIDSAFIGIPEASPLPKLLVDMHFFHSLPEWLDGESNIDFLTYLARKFLQDRSDFFTRTDQATAQLASCS